MADDAPDFASIPPADGYDTLGECAAEVARLAALPPHEYDRVRRSEAQRLGVRVGTLDKAVESTRPREAAGQGQGEPIMFEDPDPWPDLVNGAKLLDAIAAFLTDHLALRPHDGTKVALWVLHTYVVRSGLHLAAPRDHQRNQALRQVHVDRHPERSVQSHHHGGQPDRRGDVSRSGRRQAKPADRRSRHVLEG